MHLRLFKGLRKSRNASQEKKTKHKSIFLYSFGDELLRASGNNFRLLDLSNSRLSTAFTFTRCTKMKNSQAGHFVSSFIHIMEEPWRSSVHKGCNNHVFQQNWWLKLLINGSILCSPPVYVCSPTAGRESLELSCRHHHYLFPLVLFLISRQQACLRSSFWSLWPRSTFGVHKTAWWKQGSQPPSPFSLWITPTHILQLNSSLGSTYQQLDSAAQIILTCYFSIYSGIQWRQSGLLNTSFEYKAEHTAAVQKKIALSREKSVCWGD